MRELVPHSYNETSKSRLDDFLASSASPKLKPNPFIPIPRQRTGFIPTYKKRSSVVGALLTTFKKGIT